MTYIKINNTLYPATISGRFNDLEWDNRSSKSININMSYEVANKLFVNSVIWSIIQYDNIPMFDENGNYIGTETRETEFDNSDYCIAGDIIDHRDGSITVKMGKLTELEEAYEIMFGGIV